MAAFGRVDSLFANAGTSGMGKFPTDFDLDEWNRVMDVNLTGVFLTTRIVADHLVERGEGGSIVLTGSVVARLALPLAPHYTASKGAVLSLGRSLANRLGRHGIRVNVLSPGWVETEMAEGVISDERSAGYFMSRIPLRRWGAIEDFEGPAVFRGQPDGQAQDHAAACSQNQTLVEVVEKAAASEASAFMTGAELVIDGGISSS